MCPRCLRFLFYSDAVVGIDLRRDRLLLLLLRIQLGQHGKDIMRLMPIRSGLCPRLPICLCLPCEQSQRGLVLQPVVREYLLYVFPPIRPYDLLEPREINVAVGVGISTALLDLGK
jgi:hypothetical protein